MPYYSDGVPPTGVITIQREGLGFATLLDRLPPKIPALAIIFKHFVFTKTTFSRFPVFASLALILDAFSTLRATIFTLLGSRWVPIGRPWAALGFLWTALG